MQCTAMLAGWKVDHSTGGTVQKHFIEIIRGIDLKAKGERPYTFQLFVMLRLSGLSLTCAVKLWESICQAAFLTGPWINFFLSQWITRFV